MRSHPRRGNWRSPPLAEWFRDLGQAARDHGGVYRRSLEAAKVVLTTPRPPIALHGDIHHANILDFEEHGWRVIDPKGLLGEHGFDYANLFYNPDIAFEGKATPCFVPHVAPYIAPIQATEQPQTDIAPTKCIPLATQPERFASRLAIVSRDSGIEPARLLLWIAAWGGLSAAWQLQDGQKPGVSLAIAEHALGLT